MYRLPNWMTWCIISFLWQPVWLPFYFSVDAQFSRACNIMDLFSLPDAPGWAGAPQSASFRVLLKELLMISGTCFCRLHGLPVDCLIGWTPFLFHDKQWQNTEGNWKHWHQPWKITFFFLIVFCSFSAVTLLGRHQDAHTVCKNWSMRCWHGCLSGERCRWFVRGLDNLLPSNHFWLY